MDETRFIADSNVERLGKWLRILGYDTVYGKEMSDDEIVRRALAEDRVILTRDTGIVARRIVKKYVLLDSADTMVQLRQVFSELGLKVTNSRAFTRCIVCNEAVIPISKQSAAHRVPPYVYRTQEVFAECPRCRRVYWRGTHVQNILRDLKTSLPDED